MSKPNSGVRGKKKELRSCDRCGGNFDVDKAKCTHCGAWHNPQAIAMNDETVLLSEVSEVPLTRIQNTGPWDKCFSRDGGIVTISSTLIGGQPGAGKSTMALQLCDVIAGMTKREVMIVAAEEAKEQVKDRSQRLRVKNPHLIRIYPMGAGTDLGNIFSHRRPAAVIVDSLPGLVGDDNARAVLLCKRFKEFAVGLEAPFIIIDHVTKDDDLAGLMSLQHEVDTILFFTVDEETKVRQLTVKKNRFGPDDRYAFFDMTNEGLIEAEGYEDEYDD